jgi:hypothetical protein
MNTQAGGGALLGDSAHPVNSHSILKHKFPDAAIGLGSTAITSSTQCEAASANKDAAISQSQAGNLAKFRGGDFPPKSWHNGTKNTGHAIVTDHITMTANRNWYVHPGTCL